MTSAAELFHSRRYRLGPRHNAVDVSGFDSSLSDADYSSSYQHRTSNRRHNRHHSSQNNRRYDDGCDIVPRRIHRRRLDHSEHDPVHPEQGPSLSPSGSIINSDDSRSIHRRRATGSDRLPGAVLLARERLLERLRGVSASGNRDDNPLEMASETWQALTPLSSSRGTRRNYPPGLNQHAFNCLQLQVFSNGDENSRECTICLEGFRNGDKLVRLGCKHRFHSGCLFPWVRVCGACPNCRSTIVVTVR